MEREVTQELAHLQSGGKGSVSGSEIAHRIAKAYHGVLARAFETKRAFDPYLGSISDYFYRQTHDPVKLSAVGRDDWVAFAAKNYGEKSFPELVGQDKIEAFRQVYDDIVSGTHSSPISADYESGNIMQRMARRRTLIPNDWEAFHEYNQQFGRGNIHDTILSSLQQSAHDIGVIQKFGSNPKETFDRVMSMLDKSASPEERKLLNAKKGEFREALEIVTQRSPTPITDIKAKLLRGAAKVESVSKLGSVWLSSFSDAANFTTVLSDLTGKNYLSVFAEGASEYAKFFSASKEAQLAALEQMGLFSKSAFYHLQNELGSPVQAGRNLGDKLEGGLNRAIEWQSHYSLADNHRRALDAGVATMLARELGTLSEIAHADLSPQTHQALRRYGIGGARVEGLSKGS
jgi:hypothetical protein